MAIKIKSNRRTARLLLGVHLDETGFSDVFGYGMRGLNVVRSG